MPRCIRRTGEIAALLAGVALAGCGGGAATRGDHPAPPGIITEQLENGQWLTAARDYAGTRFSYLSEITPANVAGLKVAWTFSTGVRRGHEAAPLIVGNTMYVVAPFPNTLYAIDLREPGKLKWRYDPVVLQAAQGVACCDVVNRGAAFSGGRIFFNTLDAQTIAVDAETGRELWKTRVGDINKGESMTMAPLVERDKVLVGNSGGEFGVRGWLTALDASSGKIAWRAYSTGPDSDVLIGKSFRPYYPADRTKDLGVNTWPPDAWKVGGGSVWGWITYDPELDLVYYGTANPGPWNPDQRPGDNKWTASIFARKPDTGEAIWAYQMSPHDLYDYDGVNECVLLDLEINGRRRKVLVHADRAGHMYVIDRATGQVLKADFFAHTNTSRGVDLMTGRPIMVPEKAPGSGKTVRDICPAAPGAKDWQPMAYSRRTGLLYVPHNNLCMDVQGAEANYIAGTPYVGPSVLMHPGPGGNRGFFTAWDPVRGTPAWRIPEKFPVWSGALVTNSNVAFYGTMDGYFKAVDATNGRPLWQFKTESGIIGQPVTYKGPDGKQYVAILAGVGDGRVQLSPVDSTRETARELWVS